MKQNITYINKIKILKILINEEKIVKFYFYVKCNIFSYKLINIIQ